MILKSKVVDISITKIQFIQRSRNNCQTTILKVTSRICSTNEDIYELAWLGDQLNNYEEKREKNSLSLKEKIKILEDEISKISP